MQNDLSIVCRILLDDIFLTISELVLQMHAYT